MEGQADFLETTMRGAAAGMSFLLAFTLGVHGRKSRTSLFGALFSFSTGIYVLVSGHLRETLTGFAAIPIATVAIWGTVFFWWFGAALFDDSFRWRWWRFAPMGVLPLSFFARDFDWVGGGVATTTLYLHLIVNMVLFADVLRLSLINAADDLVNPRRRFRIAFCIVVGIFGIGIAIAELAETRLSIPGVLLKLHAGAILLMSLCFGVWILRPRTGVFAENAPLSPAPMNTARASIASVDQGAYEKLNLLMEDGVYRSEGLTVAVLAEQVGVPEHQLRKLINGALGFRNFSSFLNSYRIKDAEAALADPENARRQVLQIALDLGYGSIAPFNRAFKQATGKTPTEYRREKLGAGLIDPEKS